MADAAALHCCGCLQHASILCGLCRTLSAAAALCGFVFTALHVLMHCCAALQRVGPGLVAHHVPSARQAPTRVVGLLMMSLAAAAPALLAPPALKGRAASCSAPQVRMCMVHACFAI
jgi:hypothetical protein